MVRKLKPLEMLALWACVFCLGDSVHAQAGMAGKVVSVEGGVLMRQDGEHTGQGGTGVQLKPGQLVKEGDVINTASNGKAKIMLEDKTILDVGPSALFKVQKYDGKNGGDRNVDLSMPYGTTRVSVSKPIAPGGKFQIRTRTATMGVRGTEFVVQAAMGADIKSIGNPNAKQESPSSGSGDKPKAEETKITVIQGKVEVKPEAPKKEEGRSTASEKAAPAPVMLTAGTQLTASSDASAPAPKAVTLSAEQVSAVASSSKVQDNTFSNAVNLDIKSNDSGSNGGGSSKGGGAADAGGAAAGAATRLAISDAIAAPQNQAPVLLSSSGFVGTFSPTSVPIGPPVVVPIGGLRKITINVTVKQ